MDYHWKIEDQMIKAERNQMRYKKSWYWKYIYSIDFIFQFYIFVFTFYFTT
jgi:hypothetical protein